jgi:tetratricopeptide (TPR) repeat protein
LPAGHGNVEKPFGVLPNVPLVWLALAVPLAWRSRSPEARTILRGIVAAVALYFGTCAVTVCSYFGTATRYEVEFLPALVWLAVLGFLSVERVLVSTSDSGRAPASESNPVGQRAMRWGWGVLLGLSITFNLLMDVVRCAEAHNDLGFVMKNRGRTTEAIAEYRQALRLNPEYAEAHSNLGYVLKGEGDLEEAIAHYEQAVSLKPDLAEAHNNLGVALAQVDRVQDAIGAYEQALRFKSDFTEAHYNLGTVLWQTGRSQEALEHWEQAVRLRPDFAQAHSNLGVALAKLGRLPEAIEHDEQVVQLRPDSAPAHYELGLALEHAGRVSEAIEHYEESLRLQPEFAEAQNRLTRLRTAH